MPTIEERLATIETMLSERRHDNARRMDAVERSVDALAGAVSVMSTAMGALTATTKSHAVKATCVKGAVRALEGGGAASGVVAVIILLGKVVGWW